MKFRECRFQGKYKFKKSTRKKIFDKLDIWTMNVLFSFSTLERYLDILIDETDFNPKTKVFYYKTSNTKISIDLFSKIATEYIVEHIDDFRLSKGRDE